MLRLTLAALAASVLAPALSTAQTACAPREELTERLTTEYGEALAAGGLQSQSRLMEIWASPETGTWTAIFTRADGIACVVATGTDWHQQTPSLAKLGTPS